MVTQSLSRVTRHIHDSKILNAVRFYNSKSSRNSSADTGHCNSQRLTRGRRLMWRLQILGAVILFIQKEIEKQEKYQHLARKMKNLWNTKRRATSVAVEVWGSVSKALKGHLEQLEISDRKRKMQRKEKKDRHLSLDWGLGSRLHWTLFPQGKPCVLSDNN